MTPSVQGERSIPPIPAGSGPFSALSGYRPYLIAAGIVVLIGIGVGSYFLSLPATRGSQRQNADEFADLVEGGEVSLRTGAGILEDAGDLSGGTTQLSVSQINSVMSRHARRFYPCLHGHRGRVTLDFVINSDGSVAGVSVPGSSGPLRDCMAGRMRSIRFPTFSAPRMRASYYFEVSE